MEMLVFVPFFVVQLLYRRRRCIGDVSTNFKKERIVAQKFHVFHFCCILRGNERRARRSSAKSKLHRSSIPIRWNRVSVEMALGLLFENRSLQRNVCLRGMFQPRHLLIFSYRYLVRISSFFYLCQSVSSRIPPDMSCHPHTNGRTNSPPTLDAACVVP